MKISRKTTVSRIKALARALGGFVQKSRLLSFGMAGLLSFSSSPFGAHSPTFRNFLSIPFFETLEETAGFPVAGVRNPRRTLTVVATAYSSTPDQTDDTPFITANGAHVEEGIIAANFLPFGAHVRFPEVYGDKVFVVADRMNERYGRGRIDVWMSSRPAAEQFGAQVMKMELF